MHPRSGASASKLCVSGSVLSSVWERPSNGEAEEQEGDHSPTARSAPLLGGTVRPELSRTSAQDYQRGHAEPSSHLERGSVSSASEVR